MKKSFSTITLIAFVSLLFVCCSKKDGILSESPSIVGKWSGIRAVEEIQKNGAFYSKDTLTFTGTTSYLDLEFTAEGKLVFTIDDGLGDGASTLTQNYAINGNKLLITSKEDGTSTASFNISNNILTTIATETQVNGSNTYTITTTYVLKRR